MYRGEARLTPICSNMPSVAQYIFHDVVTERRERYATFSNAMASDNIAIRGTHYVSEIETQLCCSVP